MDPIVFMAVLLAAALHASWNALVKNAGDKHLSMAGIVIGHAPFALAVMPFVPLPAAQSWPYLGAGVVLHLCYQFFLLNSYRVGDLTQVYPIARGVAPMIVALVSVALLGIRLSATELLAVFTIGAGIMSLVFVRGSDGVLNPRAGLMALATGCFIAGYSLVDGLGAREAGTGVGFYAWMSTINAVAFALIMAWRKPNVLKRLAGEGRWIAILGGGGSFVAYAIVTWAFTQAPIALVTALRETSIIFALLIGVLFLKERLNLAKLVSTTVTLAGAILLRFAR
ncbi:MAG: DMT family transporter [Hyphomicrobiales bacterium]|nr:DMT family transporter [Hyphomicrobiales bacterium]